MKLTENSKLTQKEELVLFSYLQPVFACSKATIETLEQGVKYVQS